MNDQNNNLQAKHQDQPDWRKSLTQLITCPRALCEQLGLNEADIRAAVAASRGFPCRVTPSFVRRMRPGCVDDPLLRQALPVAQELAPRLDYVDDPLAERDACPVPGLLHKYQGRVLLTVTSACAINCRYCFRRHFPYADNNPSREDWQQAIDYVATDASISEVILSGGEPLLADDDYLLALLQRLAHLPQISCVRVHTRLPIVLPERITASLIDCFTRFKFKTVFVLHCNHAQEIDVSVCDAVSLLRDAGIVVLNQSVLLKGVNDTVESLENLSRGLFEMGVLPYYLHLLDQVRATAHFSVSDARAQALWRALQDRLPGYLVPRLAREQVGYGSKTLIV